MKKWFIIFSLLLLNYSSLFTQDNTSDNKAKDWIKKSEEFKYKSIAKDIVNADFNQLKSMAMALGLDEQNNSTSYREALAKYYNIKLFEKEIKKKGEKIVLERAGELKSFKIVEENEENLHIIGKVKIGLYTTGEDNTETTRSIEADEVFINTKTKEITGIGNVRFKDDKMEYEGVQFYYNYELNKGALFEGRTKLIKGGDSGLEGAFFKGEKVYQTSKDDIILYNGLLTTCEEYNPHYYMSVTRLWLGEKGEWGIYNGVIHIGPIPFFYIPIYYHPKELLINPAIGFRSREGWYLNTTYYVFGKKEAEAIEDTSTSSDTTTDVTITSTQLLEQRRRNPTNVFTLTSNKIYTMLDKFYSKHKFYTSYPMFKIYPEVESIDLSLNFFTDAYTNLGFYLGGSFYIDAKYSNFPFKFRALSDFGFSRTLWKDEETGLYTYYNPKDKPTSSDGSTETSYNKNTYLNLNANPLVFRYSEWLKFSGSLFKQYVKFDYDFQMEYVTDKSYFKDFYNRRMDFTYLDLLADTISYGVQSQGMSSSGIETKGEKVVNPDYENLNTYLWTDFALNKYPNIFGLNIISNFNINTETRIKFLSPELKDFSTIKGENYLFDEGEDPKKNRYFLYSFTAPELKEFNMKGTLLDYNVIADMPDKVNVFRNNLKNKNKNDEGESSFNKLYIYINNIKNTDASTDKTKLDYKLMLPFFSKSIPLSMIALKDKDYKYNSVLYGNKYDNEQSDLKDEKEEEKKKEDKKNMVIYSEKYFNAVEEIAYEKVKYDYIKPVDFVLNYEASDKLTNTFYFDSSSNIYKEYDYDYDTVQLLLKDSSVKEKEKILDQIRQRLNIINVTNFGLTGKLSFFKFSDKSDVNPILGFSPQFFVSSIEHFDHIDLYTKYLESIGSELQDIKDKQESLIKDNFSKTELKLNYLDAIVNDFSFGLYRIRGTGIVTDLAIDLFTHNLLKERNFNILNRLNRYSDSYEEVNPVYYSNRSLYDKITKFESKFTFNVNLLQEKNPHKLSMGIGPLIKWVIPSIEIVRMKDELWQEEKEDIISNSEIDPEAKDYIYYRKNGPNLNDKISDFFMGGKFWVGPKFYRKMLDNVTYTLNYSHTLGSLNTITMANNLSFKLDNIGVFSDAYGNVEPYISVYPDDSFKLTLLNSLITYNLDIEFIKKIRDEASLTAKQKLYDEYKIMTMEKKHAFNFSVPGTLFKAQLPHDNWLNFGSNTVFKWDSSTEWDDKSQYNYFYLYSQSFSLSLLMNIFKINLGFKNYNFVDTGYGLELENGNVDLGYRILEIPVFFRCFKLILEPRVTYDFTIKHNRFIEDGRIKEYNVDYYKNNKLSFNLSADLVIGENTKYYTLFHFGVTSQNKKMYEYYNSQGVHRSHWGSSNGEPVREYHLGAFFRDIGDSFNFSNNEARRESPFNLQKVEFWLEHSLCDWSLTFKYIGEPAVSNVTGRYSWENTFEFYITWNLKSKNQLMKMLNKTKVNAIYNYYDPDTQNWSGEWKQPALLLNTDNE